MYKLSACTFRVLSNGCFQTAKCRMSTQTSLLAKLRKSTGYPISKCKEALEHQNADLEMAIQWLHAEAQKGGWSKIANLEGHHMTQGLIGVFAQNSVAAMIEVNCETDFVARNVEFKGLVLDALSACVDHATKLGCEEDFVKKHFDSEELSTLKHKGASLADIVATAIGKFGEKTTLKRAICIKTSENILLQGSVHPAVGFPPFPGASVGRFGSLLLYRPKGSSFLLEDKVNADEFGMQLCQHIIGMNPSSVGEFTDADIALKEKEGQDCAIDSEQLVQNTNECAINENISLEHSDENDEDPEMETVADEEITKQKKMEVDEKRLVHQAFMLDPNCVVGEKLHSLHMEILHFERFECGEIRN